MEPSLDAPRELCASSSSSSELSDLYARFIFQQLCDFFFKALLHRLEALSSSSIFEAFCSIQVSSFLKFLTELSYMSNKKQMVLEQLAYLAVVISYALTVETSLRNIQSLPFLSFLWFFFLFWISQISPVPPSSLSFLMNFIRLYRPPITLRNRSMSVNHFQTSSLCFFALID